jgi:competence protein ComEC
VVTKHITAAILFAVLLYAGILPRVASSRYASLVPRASATSVTGRVVSNPVKLSGARGGESMYRFDVGLERVGMSFSGDGTFGAERFESGARGVMSVLYPASLLEAAFPGKLYSAAAAKNSRAIFIDSGIRLTLRGKTTANFFVAESAEYADGDGQSGQRRLSFLRSASRLAFRRALYAWGNAGGLFLALVTGSREYAEARLSTLFAAAGLAHVLALSGMHLSIFTGFSSKIGKKAGAKAGAALSLFAVLVFVWFAGFTPSLRRAFLCFVINFCAKFCGKTPSTESEGGGMASILAFAFVLHVCIAPAEAASVSFILSYLGLAGILVAGNVLRILFSRAAYSFRKAAAAKRAGTVGVAVFIPARLREKLTGAGNFLVSGTSAGAGAFLATAPVTARMFGYLTPISVASSLVVSPLVTVFILAGICCFALTLVFPGLTFLSGRLMNALYDVIIACVSLFSRAPLVRL